MNHPLNTVGYLRVAGMLESTLQKLNEYLDLKIKLLQKELDEKEKNG